MRFKKYIKLLALTHATGNGKATHEWCPFAKSDTLNTIIKNYNERCIQSYQELWNDPIFITTYGEGIRVEPCDLSMLDNITNLDYFKNISIILIDLDAIGENELERIKNYFQTEVFVAQVSRTLSTRLTDMGPPFYLSDPEVIVDQETLVEWLTKFCKAYRKSIQEGTTYIASNITSIRPKDDLAAHIAYLKALPEVAAKVRDVAIMKGLSEEETLTLAQQAVMQEFALKRIEAQVHSQTNFDRVILDAIREPVIDMPNKLGFQSPALRQVNLVELHVTQPMYEMTAEQRNIMLGFGIKEEVEPFAIVVPDQSTVWDSVERLNGVAQTTTFSADLPIGLGGMR